MGEVRLVKQGVCLFQHIKHSMRVAPSQVTIWRERGGGPMGAYSSPRGQGCQAAVVVGEITTVLSIDNGYSHFYGKLQCNSMQS